MKLLAAAGQMCQISIEWVFNNSIKIKKIFYTAEVVLTFISYDKTEVSSYYKLTVIRP